MLKRIAFIAAIFSALPLCAHAACSVAGGVVSACQITAYGSDDQGCVLLQVDTQPQWYAVAKQSPMFDPKQKLLEGAAFTGYAISFWVGSAITCGGQAPLSVLSPYIGTAH